MSHSEHAEALSAKEALDKLMEGNKRFVESGKNGGDVSSDIRYKTCHEGQHPYAIVISCSDSRVIPESIFQAGIGEIFVIRVAGNVIDKHQLGSIEYAADHLGSKLVMVLGHDHCGAVDAAINHNPGGYIKYITDEIKLAIGGEKDADKACCLNVKNSVKLIQEDPEIQHMEKENGLMVVGAVYHLESGSVELL